MQLFFYTFHISLSGSCYFLCRLSGSEIWGSCRIDSLPIAKLEILFRCQIVWEVLQYWLTELLLSQINFLNLVGIYRLCIRGLIGVLTCFSFVPPRLFNVLSEKPKADMTCCEWEAEFCCDASIRQGESRTWVYLVCTHVDDLWGRGCDATLTKLLMKGQNLGVSTSNMRWLRLNIIPCFSLPLLVCRHFKNSLQHLTLFLLFIRSPMVKCS